MGNLGARSRLAAGRIPSRDRRPPPRGANMIPGKKCNLPPFVASKAAHAFRPTFPAARMSGYGTSSLDWNMLKSAMSPNLTAPAPSGNAASAVPLARPQGAEPSGDGGQWWEGLKHRPAPAREARRFPLAAQPENLPARWKRK